VALLQDLCDEKDRMLKDRDRQIKEILERRSDENSAFHQEVNDLKNRIVQRLAPFARDALCLLNDSW